MTAFKDAFRHWQDVVLDNLAFMGQYDPERAMRIADESLALIKRWGETGEDRFLEQAMDLHKEEFRRWAESHRADEVGT